MLSLQHVRVDVPSIQPFIPPLCTGRSVCVYPPELTSLYIICFVEGRYKVESYCWGFNLVSCLNQTLQSFLLSTTAYRKY